MQYRAGNMARIPFARLAHVDEQDRAVGKALLQFRERDIFERRRTAIHFQSWDSVRHLYRVEAHLESGTTCRFSPAA